MVRHRDGIVSDVWALVFNYFPNEVVSILLGWTVSAGVAYVLVDLSLSCSIVLLDHVGVDAFTVIFVINSELSLSKEMLEVAFRPLTTGYHVETNLGAHITCVTTQHGVGIPLVGERFTISIEIVKEQDLKKPNVARVGAI